MGFSTLFQQQVGHARNANAVYGLVDAAYLVMIGLIGGARSLSQCVALWSDQVLRRLAGWQRVPDETTLGRLFKEVRERHVSELETLNHVLRQRVWARAAQVGRSRIGLQTLKWLAADATVKTVYGRQEGAAKGYNPHKRGALSYHPLLVFCTATKEIVQAWLRTGSAYTSNGIVAFMEQLVAQFPPHQRLVLRADSGFFDGALLEYLDQRGHGYLIKVKLRNLDALLAQQHWAPVRHQPGWEQCEFTHQAHGWSCPRFFLAVRCPGEATPTLLTGANQLRLKLVSPPLAAQVWPDWLALSNPA